MEKFLKSQTIIASLGICSIVILGFWTLEKNNCLKIIIGNETSIERGSCKMSS